MRGTRGARAASRPVPPAPTRAAGGAHRQQPQINRGDGGADSDSAPPPSPTATDDSETKAGAELEGGGGDPTEGGRPRAGTT